MFKSARPANPEIVRIANDLKLHFGRSRQALIKSGTGDFSDAETDVSTLFKLDPLSGHGWYYAGELKRVKDQSRFTPKSCLRTPLAGDSGSLDAYHDDFYRYLEIEASLPASETQGDDTGSEICYQRGKGYCLQRTAWIQHLLAGDFYAEALAQADRQARKEKLEHALKHAEAEAQFYPRGFEQCTPTKTLKSEIQAAIGASR